MSYTEATIQLLSPQGFIVENDATAPYLPYLASLDEDRLREFHRQMVVTRRFDIEAGNLQRQGQMALWIPSLGQEAAQVGSAFAARPQDHIFPAYREHAVGRIRGLDFGLEFDEQRCVNSPSTGSGFSTTTLPAPTLIAPTRSVLQAP